MLYIAPTALFASLVSADNDLSMTEYEQMVVMKELLESYDADYRAQIFEPLSIMTNFYVQMLSEIDQTAMDYEMTIFFRFVFRLLEKHKSVSLLDKCGKMIG